MKKTKFVTIGLIQNKVSIDQKANLRKTVAAVEVAARKGAKIICLQELYKTIYFPQFKLIPRGLPRAQNNGGLPRGRGVALPLGQARGFIPRAQSEQLNNFSKDLYAETIPGESTQTFKTLAKKYHVVIIVPIFEKDRNGKYFNSAVVINEQGKLLATYHKIHLPEDPKFYEQDYFENGTQYRIYQTKYATFAVLICYDQWFPEAARIVALQGAEIIFYPTAIGNMVGYKSQDGDWHDAWETVMRGHAIANAVHIAAVNRVGVEDQLRFWGQSFVCDSFGKILKRASKTKEEILLSRINLAHNVRIREGWGFYRNRCSDTYGSLAT